MKTHLIQIGNSRGIRLSKALLEQAQLGEELEVSAEDSQIIIRSASKPRQGWEETFRAMAWRGDDHLLESSSIPTEWDNKEWQWT